MAAVTNDHRHSDLKEHRFVILQFCSSEVHCHWLRIKVSAELHSFLEALEGNPSPCLSQLLMLLGVLGVPWPVAASLWSLPPLLHGHLPSLSLCSYKDVSPVGVRVHPPPTWLCFNQ